jgi:hypothetical protein
MYPDVPAEHHQRSSPVTSTTLSEGLLNMKKYSETFQLFMGKMCSPLKKPIR